MDLATIVLTSVATAFAGLVAFFYQQHEARRRSDLVERGFDQMASAIAYALNVYLQNWALTARTLRYFQDEQARAS